MQLFTTCQRCGDTLSPTFTGQETHPGCEPTEMEKLCREFVDAIQRGDEGEAKRLEKLVNAPPKIPSLGSAALWYAKKAGWPVFPLRPGEKVPAVSGGFKSATRDEQRIREWWGSNPNYNIGIPTGPTSGFDVIDIDGEIGFRSLAELGEDKLPPVHGKVATPRGLHLLTLATEDGNRAGILPGIDYRSIGGFVVGVPSVVDGRRYTWLMPPSPAILKGAA